MPDTGGQFHRLAGETAPTPYAAPEPNVEVSMTNR